MHEDYGTIARARRRNGRVSALVGVGAGAFLLGVAVVGLLWWSGIGPSDFVTVKRSPPAALVASPLPTPSASAPEATAAQARQAVAQVQQVVQQQGGLDSRVAAMEQRLAKLDLQLQAASGNAARTEGLLVAFAARRAVERGAPLGYLAEAAAIGEAEALESTGKAADAVRVYERLLKGRLVNVERVYLQLGAAAKAANDPTRAAEAFAHVLYEFPLGENAPAARAELDQLGALAPLAHDSRVYKAELGRAERLFGAKRYIEARAVFDDLADVARGDDRELMKLRLALCAAVRPSS